MPIYEYICRSCGQEFEELVGGDEKPPCHACGQPQVEKQLSVPAAHVAGPTPACPVRNSCGMSECCGQNCGMAQWK